MALAGFFVGSTWLARLWFPQQKGILRSAFQGNLGHMLGKPTVAGMVVLPVMIPDTARVSSLSQS